MREPLDGVAQRRDPNPRWKRAPDGRLTIRRPLLPRLVNGAFGGLLAFAITVTLVPLWPAVILAALTSALVYAWFARPLAVFELDRHVLQMANRQLSFADLGMVHMIERRDEEPRGDRFFELLMGPRLRTRYEVYFRVRDEPLVLAQFSKKTTADRLVTEVRSLMGPPQ